MTSPITTEWLDLPADIRSAAETAVGHLRPLTHAETLLIVGRAIKAERERTIEDVLGALTAHELYQYRPKAFEGFIEYARTTLTSSAPPSPKQAAVSEGGEDE